MSTELKAGVGQVWTMVGHAGDWPDEGGRLVIVGTRRMAVFHHAGGWYALDDRCPHERVGLVSGPLAAGRVTCPGHGWSFRLSDGAVVVGPAAARVTTHPVRVRDGMVEIG